MKTKQFKNYAVICVFSALAVLSTCRASASSSDSGLELLPILAAGGAQGQANMTVSSQALSLNDVTKITISVTGPGISSPISHDLVESAGVWQGVLGSLPVGTNRTFAASAYNASNVLIYQGQATSVTINPDQTTNVIILLQEVTPAPAFENAAPLIDSVTASVFQPAPSDTVNLAVTAHDPNAGDTLTYSWTATGGTFNDESSMSPVWSAPATEGVITFTVTVTDQLGVSAGLSFNLAVQADTGAAHVTVGVNNFPVVSNVNASPTSIDRGESTNLSVTATDGDGDSLTYAWSASCAGTFNDASLRNPVFTADVAASYGPCTLNVSVSDGRGGVNTGALQIQVAQPGSVNFAPNIQSSFQSSLSPAPGGQVIFRVIASDPEGTNLTFTWSGTAGVTGSSTETDNSGQITSEITWTAPSCGSGIVMSVTVTDAFGLNTTLDFPTVVIGGQGTCTPSISETILNASDGQVADDFGYSVSISGNYAIVGAPDEDGGSGDPVSTVGAAYVYELDNSGNWSEVAILHASDMQTGDHFGTSVSISGNYAIVGAHSEDGGSGDAVDFAGAAYVFERDASGYWNEVAILHASDMQSHDTFGFSVSISGNYAIVGARGEAGGSGDPVAYAGAAYVFERDNSGNWTEVSILHASDMQADDYFGGLVSISGNYVIVGAIGEDGGSGDPVDLAGAAYVFERDASGNWNEVTILHASDMQARDWVGSSVSISGNYAIVGARGEDGGSGDPAGNAGAAYVFERDASGNWNEVSILHASDIQDDDYFGESVSISGDRIVVGAGHADGEPVNLLFSAGAAYLYERDGSGNWNEVSILNASDMGQSAFFGYSVAISGDNVMVGAYTPSSNGSAYIYGLSYP